MREAVMLAWDMVLRPSRAVNDILGRQARGPAASLRPAFAVYGVYLLASATFSALKPPDFPRAEAEGLLGGGVEGGWTHWLGVELYNAAFTAAFIALTVWFVRTLSEGRLSRRIFLCGALSAVPLGLSLAYLMLPHGTPGWPMALGWLALCAGLVPGLRRAEGGLWAPLASFLLAMDAVFLAALPLFVAAVLLRSDGLYVGVARGLALWMLGLSAYGVARLARVPTARAFCAVVFALVWQSCLTHAFFVMGLMSKDALKSLMAL